MSMTKAEAALVLGAKESEVRRVRDDLVTTYPDTTYRVADGAVAAIVDPDPRYQGPLPIERTAAAEDDDEETTDVEPAPAPRGRRSPRRETTEDADS